MIIINEDYRIKADSQNFILCKKRIVDDKKSKDFGKEVWDNVGYYGTISNALGGFVKKATRDFVSKEKKQDIRDVIKEVDRLDKIIEKLGV